MAADAKGITMMKVAKVLLVVAGLLSWSAVMAQPALQVGVSKQRVLNLEQRLERMAVGDPEIASVRVLNSRELLVTGKKRGETTLILWTRGADKPTRYSLLVGPGDLPAILQADRRQTLRTQVQTDITIAEVSRSALRQIGTNFVNTGEGANVLRVSPPGVSGGVTGVAGGAAGLVSNTAFQPIGDAFNLVFADEDSDFFGFLSILERQGLMRTLATPSLVALSGQTATFLAGGEFPIPVVQSGGSDGSITIEFKEFGVRLSLTPTVLSEDRIVLKVAPEVSELDFTSGVTIQGVRVPGVKVRRTETTVRLGDGETFVISGLVSQEMVAAVDKIPWLGDIPIIGALFRSTKYHRQERELIMVVTPHLVTPLKAGTEVPLPGAKYDQYDPSASQVFFFETGDFESGRTGFTR